MKVLVFGGREYGSAPPQEKLTKMRFTERMGAVKRASLERHLLHDKLSAFDLEFGISLVIHGLAKGADRLGMKWAQDRSIPDLRFAADWDQHGVAAGPIRNAQMLRDGQPDVGFEFPGGAGTRDMHLRCVAAGLTLVVTTTDEIEALMLEHA